MTLPSRPAEPPTHAPTPRDAAPRDAADAAAALRVHATLRGSGRAYDGERLLAAVDYRLNVVDEARGAASPADGAPESSAERPNVYGLLRSLEPAALAEYVGTRLALALDDGRRLDFAVAKVLWPGTFLIQSLGDLR